MNADAAEGVSSSLGVGAKLSFLLWLGIGMLIGGGLFAAAGAAAVLLGVRRPASPSSEAATPTPRATTASAS
jgi:hypothetical protein